MDISPIGLLLLEMVSSWLIS